MTRINLISPSDLTNRHLVAEYKEITQFCHLVKKRVDSKSSFDDIPKRYTLNGGHCKFFYNKGAYLFFRLVSIKDEMVRRNLKVDLDKYEEKIKRIRESYSKDLFNDYVPITEEYKIVIERISQRINEKKHLYPDADRFFNAIGKYI